MVGSTHLHDATIADLCPAAPGGMVGATHPTTAEKQNAPYVMGATHARQDGGNHTSDSECGTGLHVIGNHTQCGMLGATQPTAQQKKELLHMAGYHHGRQVGTTLLSRTLRRAAVGAHEQQEAPPVCGGSHAHRKAVGDHARMPHH